MVKGKKKEAELLLLKELRQPIRKPMGFTTTTETM
jgi:hypothetical protein